MIPAPNSMERPSGRFSFSGTLPSMQVFVFGNPDIEIDSLPVRLLPKLREAFPEVTFVTLDPNEDWDVPEHMVVVDTVVGSKEVAVYDDLKAFMAAPRMTCHDFDAYANLMLMHKLGKIKQVTIVGMPPGMPEAKVLSPLTAALKSVLTK